ncbi:MAG: POTRA domain-containing protein [Bacteroidales bacterium]|nr:BamA/TamA family outer membrane protein [Lentimicrobiaceae bacterium]MDD5693684.1 POTRA domain-containing protein [Bacteroidales bacterium]
MFIKKIILAIIAGMLLSLAGKTQVTIGDDLSGIDYLKPKEYEIGGITISGVQYLDHNVLIMLSGLSVGDRVTVPGDDISDAMRNLWDQGLFEDVKITATGIQNDVIFLNIYLKERPRMSKFSLLGIKKTEADNVKEDLTLRSGDVLTDNLLVRTSQTIKKYFKDKGFLNTEVTFRQIPDTSKSNNVILDILVDKNQRVKIKHIVVEGNSAMSDQQIKGALKKTKEKSYVHPLNYIDTLITSTLKAATTLDMINVIGAIGDYFTDNMKLRIFKSSKYIADDFKEDKSNLIKKYNQQGYRDAKIVEDVISPNPDNTIDLNLKVSEGNKYYYRNITWIGNTKYTADQLNEVLKIKKGDIYDQELLSTNLSFNLNGMDVTSLYLDNGYLFFSVDPVEVKVENDSIDLEMRIYEGKQARINKVTIKGNDRTNDHVIIREIRTKPGELFSRSDIIRTTRELAQLQYFNQEKINPVPIPNPSDGTVDIQYEVEETSSDQIELSGGWGYGRVIGTLGVSFNNFSLKNVFTRSAWRPVPTGDGQKLSVRLQSYGKGYISYNASFTEPWLGGRKPTSFTTSYYHSLYSNGMSKSDISRQSFVLDGITFMLGKRLTWPDDYFTLIQTINLQRYKLDNYTTIFSFGTGTGEYNSITYGITLARNSVDAPIFARTGSEISLSLKLTPPYSAFSDKDYSLLEEDEKYKWVEYHKWAFRAVVYKPIAGNLVFALKFRYGFLGAYNTDIGVTPFERYYLGGDGLSGYNNMDGREIIGFRGYENESLTPNKYTNQTKGGTIYSRNTLEIRYPLSLNPSSTIYMAAFLEAGNSWEDFRSFQPFNLYRSAGFGVRVYLPMFGLLGLDWGYGFDEVPGLPNANGSQFHFSINQSID